MGEQVAKYCQRHLPEAICAQPLNGSADKGIEAAFVQAFHSIDDMLRDKKCLPELQALSNALSSDAMGNGRMARRLRDADPDLMGCTCVMCCITESQMVVANCGDSRAVLSRAGKAKELSQDHKPNDPKEEARIKKAGGFVEKQSIGANCQYRVNGNLNLSRALGDLEYKQDLSRPPEEQIISGSPDVDFYDRSDEDEFLLICCDGVWDVKTSQQAIDYVRCRLPAGAASEQAEMVKVLEDLLDDCVSKDLRQTQGLGGDNMTAVLVVFPTFRPEAASSIRSVNAAKSVTLEASKAVAEAAAARAHGASSAPGVAGPSIKLLKVLPEEPLCRGDSGSLKVVFALEGEKAASVSAGDLDVWFCQRTSELEVFVLPSTQRENVSLKQWTTGEAAVCLLPDDNGYPEASLCRRKNGQVTVTVRLRLN